MTSHYYRTMFFGFLTLFVLTSFFHVFSQETFDENAFSFETHTYYHAVNDDYKFVWFKVYKVGTSTIKDIFKKNNIQFSIIHTKPALFNPIEYQGYFKFAFVRNPWSRIVSCYLNRIVQKNLYQDNVLNDCRGKDFEYFVNFINTKDLLAAKTNKHIRLQTSLIPVNDIDFIGRMETFSQDLEYVLTALGIPDKKIPKSNATKHEHYSHYYNERTKQIIANKYKDDIETFGYEFEYE